MTLSGGSPENILLYLSKQQEDYVQEIFAQLAQLGFPPQQQTPHITITFAPRMAADVVDRAGELLPVVIPADLRRVGTVVFGIKRKQTVAWLLEGPEELDDVARELSGLNRDGRGTRWTPHLTMGLRLPREIVPDYIRALDQITSPHFNELTVALAALWKPSSQHLTVLAEAAGVNVGGHPRQSL